jgi:hypothetical protein
MLCEKWDFLRTFLFPAEERKKPKSGNESVSIFTTGKRRAPANGIPQFISLE